MDLERSGLSEGGRKGDSSCSICWECVLDAGERSIAKLKCGHQFHLDCIGSAFNAKGAMQCPNCRKVEKGQWLYGNGHWPLSELNVDELVNEDSYDLPYSELPFGIHWCPFRGFMQLSSLLDEAEPHANTYHDLLGGAAFGDLSSASGSANLCPYLALHGFPHAAHPTPSNSADPIPDPSFHGHSSGLGGASSNTDSLSSRGFSATGRSARNWQLASLPFVVSSNTLNITDQSSSQLASSLSRNDPPMHQRGSPFQPYTLVHGSVGPAGSNNGPHGHTYQQSSGSSSGSAPFAPTRRTRQRESTPYSSERNNASIVENGGFYGFSVSSVSSANRAHQDGEVAGRHFNRVHGWLREGFAPLPWIPVEGEPWWWSPFHPSQNPHARTSDSSTRSYVPQRVNVDNRGVQRPTQNASNPHVRFHRMPRLM